VHGFVLELAAHCVGAFTEFGNFFPW
jgi:hypothetical protein